jgi:hypothetical protein
MPITQSWDNPEKTVYLIDLKDKWSWTEFDNAIDSGMREIATQPSKVDVILWVDSELPPGNAMMHLRRAGGTQPPNAYRTVIVQSSMFLSTLIRTIDKAKRWEGPALVKTIEEARALLKAD